MPRTPTSAPSREILEAALQGLESQKQRLDEQIAHVRGLLGTSGTGRKAGRPPKNPEAQPSSAGHTPGGRSKRVLSAEARKRIAAAQKKRWAAYRKSQ